MGKGPGESDVPTLIQELQDADDPLGMFASMSRSERREVQRGLAVASVRATVLEEVHGIPDGIQLAGGSGCPSVTVELVGENIFGLESLEILAASGLVFQRGRHHIRTVHTCLGERSSSILVVPRRLWHLAKRRGGIRLLRGLASGQVQTLHRALGIGLRPRSNSMDRRDRLRRQFVGIQCRPVISAKPPVAPERQGRKCKSQNLRAAPPGESAPCPR